MLAGKWRAKDGRIGLVCVGVAATPRQLRGGGRENHAGAGRGEVDRPEVIAAGVTPGVAKAQRMAALLQISQFAEAG